MEPRTDVPRVRCRIERPRNCCRVRVSAIGPAGRAETHICPYRLAKGMAYVIALVGGAA